MDLKLRTQYKKYSKLTKDEKEYFIHKENIFCKDFYFFFFIAICFLGISYLCLSLSNYILGILSLLGSAGVLIIVLVFLIYERLNQKDFLNKGE